MKLSMRPVTKTRFALAFFCLKEAHTISIPCRRNFEYDTCAFHHSKFVIGDTEMSYGVLIWLLNLTVDRIVQLLPLKKGHNQQIGLLKTWTKLFETFKTFEQGSRSASTRSRHIPYGGV